MILTEVTRRLVRRKPLNARDFQDGKLDRCLTLFDLTALGVGATMGVGIYVLAGAVAKDVAGPSVLLSFLIAGIASTFSGLCYAELGARVPKAGSAYVYSYVTVGEGLAFVIGWNLILEYAIGTASVARGYSGYIDSLMNRTMAKAFRSVMPLDIPYISPYPDFCALLITLLLTLVLCIGVKESTRFNNIFTCLNIFVVVFVTFCGMIKSDLHNWHLTPEELPSEKYGVGGFFPYGISGTLAGAATCFYGFVGFDTIATSGEEAQNPQRNIPLAIIMSLAAVFLAYCGVSSSLTLMVPYFNQDATAPLPYAFHETGWIWAGYIVSAGALFGLSTSLMGAMFPLPRILYAMSTDGLLFKWMAHVHSRYQTPFRATVIGGFLAGSVAMLFELKNLVDMMSIGTLMAYSMVAIAVMILRYRPNDSSVSREYFPLEKRPLNPLANSSEPEVDSEEEEEIVYCSDDTIGLNPKSEQNNNKVDCQEDNPCRVLFCPWTCKAANDISSAIANWLIIVSSICCFILAMALIHSEHKSMAITWILFGMIVFFSFWIWLLPKDDTKLSFKVPMVPFLPMLSVFINLYLMLKLSPATWIRFSVWMTIGAAIYSFYGWKHSEEEAKK